MKNKIQKLKDLLGSVECDFVKYEMKNNKTAATRVRTNLSEMRKLAQEIRMEILEEKKNIIKMASALKNLSSYNELNIPNAKGLRFGIVLSEWNKEITHVLYNGAFETLLKHNVNENDILLYQVPGTYELPVAAEWISDQKVDAVICLGCVIKGDTDHDKYINQSVAMALQYLSIQKKYHLFLAF